jgi:ERCC4-related helicase
LRLYINKAQQSLKIIDYFFDMELIVLLSSGKGSWAQVSGLMKYGEWEKIIILGNDFAKNFTHEKEFEFIQIDLNKKIKELQKEFREKLKGKIQGMEVALSIASGDGKEHMALVSALINLPVGVRFAALTKEGVIDL